MGERVEYRPLTREELNALAGEELPERAVTSLLNANIAAPINTIGVEVRGVLEHTDNHQPPESA